jgi:hypothetical protein
MHAQHENVLWKNDPTYSVYNYKHPNKAVAAKKLQHQQLTQIITVREPAATGPQVTKVMVPNRRIIATEKKGKNKIKTPLAIRRRASEKLPEAIIYPDANEQLDD